MNLDPFGHIAVARHFLNVARSRGWKDRAEEIEKRIKQMEADEIEYWNTPPFTHPGVPSSE
jgi:hypothetical protein